MKFFRNPKIFSKKTRHGWYILQNNSKYIRELNDSAGYIWGLARQPVSIDHIANKLAKKYHLPLQESLKDTEEFVYDYVRLGLFNTK